MAAARRATCFHLLAGLSIPPVGIWTAIDGGSYEISPATAETLTAPDVYSVAEAPLARYRNNGRFVRDLSTYHHLWQLSTPRGTVAELFKDDRLIGRPFSLSSANDAYSDVNPAASSDNPLILYGDLSAYYWVDRVGMAVMPPGAVAELREYPLRRNVRCVLLLACRRRCPHRWLAGRVERGNHRMMTILGGREQITETGSNRSGWFDLPANWFMEPEVDPPATFAGLPVGFTDG